MRWMILAAALSMAVSTTSQAAPIYKWVDAQGVTHFDAQPPAGQQVEEINVQKPPPAPAASTASEPDPQQQDIDAKVKKQVRAQEARMADNCEVLRTNLAQLQNNPRVREQTEGGTKRLTDDERKARVAETQRTIAEYCR
ncbi:DUF4124 domain-containing protein [Pseudomonas cichorii]|uniref:DUF4124 domain-containing protein n=1 Tax=Pseudomonas cichorii TaxID=36746 RepID=UPI0018E5C269|nr:DUF4124 domain-containing protein [Pseudomonas cichorii]MBI6853359.1 DUF4124 domain-containing protein [Pseudomonas cichorii]MBX8486762.1 DUF4124 domain-containing protein [Pseudomonas cichorii]MBX8495934.1 DUF4124 domain-containing protein [Pseudomonas cichorii]MBX8517557.1 DUF4124 domain-containing protein [Pseudomonas cichorii]